MNYFHLLLGVILSNFLSAQLSYEFKSALPPVGDVLKTIGSSHFGDYINDETGTIFQFNEDGVSMIALINSYITKEQVRESSRFQVRNNYLFGVLEGDSIPCILEDEKYYFGIRQKTILNDASHKGVLKKINENTYIINFYDVNGYTPSLITFKGNSIHLIHFDYDSETHIFDAIVSKQEIKGSGYTTWLLNPNQKEWDQISKQAMFGKETIFVKQSL